jgi:formate/nitrite transporter FocA (FNT family)
MELAVVVLLIVPLIAANWVATRLVLRDEVVSRKQAIAQLFLVWLLPIIGAVLVFAVHRRTEAPSRKYREAPDPGDDFGLSGRSTRSTHHADE